MVVAAAFSRVVGGSLAPPIGVYRKLTLYFESDPGLFSASAFESRSVLIWAQGPASRQTILCQIRWSLWLWVIPQMACHLWFPDQFSEDNISSLHALDSWSQLCLLIVIHWLLNCGWRSLASRALTLLNSTSLVLHSGLWCQPPRQTYFTFALNKSAWSWVS